MGKESKDGYRKYSTILHASVAAFVIIAVICTPSAVGETVPSKQVRIMVCEVDPQLIVTIPLTDFDPSVYSKDISLCR